MSCSLTSTNGDVLYSLPSNDLLGIFEMITGSGEIETGSLTINGSAKLIHFFTGSIVVDAVVLQGSGKRVIIGSGEGSAKKITLRAEGLSKSANSGVGAIIINPVSVNGIGALQSLPDVNEATGNITTNNITASGAGKVLYLIVGNGDIHTHKNIVRGEGSKKNLIGASGGLTLKALEISGFTKRVIFADGDMKLGNTEVSGDGRRGLQSNGSITCANIIINGSSYFIPVISGSGDIYIKSLNVIGGGKRDLKAIGNVNIDGAVISGDGKRDLKGLSNILLNKPRVDSSGEVQEQYEYQLYRVTAIEEMKGKPYKIINLEAMKRPINR